MKPQRGRFRLLCALLALVVAATACGGGSATDVVSGTADDLGTDRVDVVASRSFVLASAERTQAASYNFDMSMRMRMDMGFMSMEMPGNTPIVTGSTHAGTTAMRMDLGVMLEEMAESNPMFEDAMAELGDPDDLVMNMVVTDSLMYLNAPFFGAAGGAGMGLDAIVDGWGVIDLAQATGIDATSLASITGQSGADPAAVLDLLEEIGTEVTEDGREKIDGVETTRMIARVSMGDLLSAQPQLEQMAADPSMASIFSAMRDVQVEYIIHIDDRGLLRQLSFDMPMGELMQQAAAADPSIPAGMELDMEVGITMRFSDHGSADPIEIPANAVDVTAQLSQLAALG